MKVSFSHQCNATKKRISSTSWDQNKCSSSFHQNHLLFHFLSQHKKGRSLVSKEGRTQEQRMDWSTHTSEEPKTSWSTLSKFPIHSHWSIGVRTESGAIPDEHLVRSVFSNGRNEQWCGKLNFPIADNREHTLVTFWLGQVWNTIWPSFQRSSWTETPFLIFPKLPWVQYDGPVLWFCRSLDPSSPLALNVLKLPKTHRQETKILNECNQMENT